MVSPPAELLNLFEVGRLLRIFDNVSLSSGTSCPVMVSYRFLISREAPGPLRRVIALPLTDSLHGIVVLWLASGCDVRPHPGWCTLPQYVHVGYAGFAGVPVVGLRAEAVLGGRCPCLVDCLYTLGPVVVLRAVFGIVAPLDGDGK